jgi:hypothetical protein
MSRSFCTIRPASERNGQWAPTPVRYFVRLSNIIGADRDQPAIRDLKLTMELNQQFSLPAVLGTEPSAAEDEDHGMLCLQLGELPPFRGVVGRFVVGEDGTGNNVSSHGKSSTVGCASPD